MIQRTKRADNLNNPNRAEYSTVNWATNEARSFQMLILTRVKLYRILPGSRRVRASWSLQTIRSLKIRNQMMLRSAIKILLKYNWRNLRNWSDYRILRLSNSIKSLLPKKISKTTMGTTTRRRLQRNTSNSTKTLAQATSTVKWRDAKAGNWGQTEARQFLKK